MATTICINEDVKQQLKLKSVETGINQINLANRYIIEGIKNSTTPNKPIKTIEEIEEILDSDKTGDKERVVIDFDFDVPDNLKLNNDDELNSPVTDVEEIEKLLDHDKPEGDDVLEQLDGMVHSDSVTDRNDFRSFCFL